MPRDGTWDCGRRISLHPGYQTLTSPIQNRKRKECAFFPLHSPSHLVKSGQCPLLGLFFFRPFPSSLSHPREPYHQVMGDISPSYLFYYRGVVPVCPPPNRSSLVFVALVHSCISPLPSISSLCISTLSRSIDILPPLVQVQIVIPINPEVHFPIRHKTDEGNEQANTRGSNSNLNLMELTIFSHSLRRLTDTSTNDG